MRRLVAAMCLSLMTVACGPDGAGDRELIVSAAASLTDAFTTIGQDFEKANEDVAVTFNFGPSDGLAAQIVEGAPADVFASASPTWMDSVADDGPGVRSRADFAHNALAVMVPAANPAGIESVQDLARAGVKLVLAAEGVPAGDYAREMLRKAGISEDALANVVSNEEDVRGVVSKVLSGDADAGIAYVTDVSPELEEEMTLVHIPDDVNVIATYPIAVVSGAHESDLAQRFVDYVLGDGQRVLSESGFLPAS